MVENKPDSEEPRKKPSGSNTSEGDGPVKDEEGPAGGQGGRDDPGKGPVKGKEAAKKPDIPAGRTPVKKAGTGTPPRPPKSRGPSFEDLEEDPLLTALQGAFGNEKVSGQSFLEQRIYTVDSGILFDVLVFLKDQPDCDFDYLIDLTALDYPGEEKRFCMVYHLYSYSQRDMIRVKSHVLDDEVVPSVSSIWKTADWMEREVYDMFGIEFSEHPGLKRILLPDDWQGFPLRKDYDIKLQDQAWIRKHLRIRKVPS